MEGYGEFIKRHRLASGFKSQRQLAEKTGINHATISRIEKELQKPEAQTLAALAQVLDTTSYVELMVKCGYWNEDDLLEPIDENNELCEREVQYKIVKKRAKEESPSNEEDFIKDIDLTDEEILNRFDLKIDGQALTKDEAQGIIAYVRSLRSLNK